MGQVIVELKNITKFFGASKALDEINLQIEKGKFITFLGPSGCGKTTLLRIIAGFYEPDAGEITINNRRVENVPPYDRNTAMVFQEYALFPHMTVYQNVAYGLEVKNKNKTEIDAKVEEVLKLMQLSGMEKRYPNEMSGGQQQRVAVARALVMDPHALLLDEPLSNLDAQLRESVRVELRLIQKKLGLTAIYVTHDQQEALSMSDMIVVMNKGVIHQFGTPKEIYFCPRTRFVADFIGSTNLVDARVVKEDIPVVSYHGIHLQVKGNYEALVDQDVVVSIRPECIKINKVSKESNFNLPIKILHSMFLGEKVRYHVEDSYGKEWRVDSFDSGEEILEGSAYLNIQSEKSHLIQEQ